MSILTSGYKKRQRALQTCFEIHNELQIKRLQYQQLKRTMQGQIIKSQGKELVNKQRRAIGQYKIAIKPLYKNDQFALDVIEALF
jgi:hypothetical protein